MNKKCTGCGVILQDKDENEIGYVNDLNNNLCLRCFKIQNYGTYSKVKDDNEKYMKIIEKIGSTKSLVLLVVDLLCIPEDLKKVRDLLKHNNVILVLNKIDIMPNVKEEKLVSYFNKMDLYFNAITCVSAVKNINFDNLYDLIKKYKTDNKVYVVGNTNAGKSTIINKLTNLYGNADKKITISPLPSTTLDSITIDFNEYTLIDTPGVVDNGNILNYVDKKYIKKISPKNKIKPRTYRITDGQSLVIEDILRIDYFGVKNSFTFFISNDLNVKKTFSKNNNYLKDQNKRMQSFDNNNDLLINGLGFIKIIAKGKIDLYINENIAVSKRPSLI